VCVYTIATLCCCVSFWLGPVKSRRAIRQSSLKSSDDGAPVGTGERESNLGYYYQFSSSRNSSFFFKFLFYFYFTFWFLNKKFFSQLNSSFTHFHQEFFLNFFSVREKIEKKNTHPKKKTHQIDFIFFFPNEKNERSMGGWEGEGALSWEFLSLPNVIHKSPGQRQSKGARW
jgi:hypothetical protein